MSRTSSRMEKTPSKIQPAYIYWHLKSVVVTKWKSALETTYIQPHDEPGTERQRKNYFTAQRSNCVETICAPCGVVIAWAKFAKSESPTNILAFLRQVFPIEQSQPAYVCIDKACIVLCTAVANGSWDSVWMKTTWFIVDSYHYINHHSTDYLCWKWFNPAPRNG